MDLKKILDDSKYFLSKSELEINENELKKLQYLIQTHSGLYYNKDKIIISDTEYDDLLRKLKYLENKFWLEVKVSNNVWSNLKESSFEKVKHSRPMISLDNTYNEEDLNDFNDRVIKNIILSNIWEEEKSVKYTIEFKFDWLWVELIYKWWNLIQALTRGNWIEWEDVTQNVMQIDNIPKVIDYLDDLEVRWEVIMPISIFEKLNKKSKEEWWKIFSNPRNAASGSIRLLDNTVTKQRKLKFFAYDLANFEEFIKKENINNYYNVIKKLESLGFDISAYFKKCNWINEIIKSIHDFWNTKKQIDFEIDWLVIKVNDISLWKNIWTTQHHPRYAIAYKFPAEILTTKVIWVEHSIWRTWTITPIALLEPIFIWWVTISRATLHNYDEVEKLDIRIWDSVFIKRAWEVIPKIISVIKNVRNSQEIKIKVPEYCPSCDSKVIKDNNKVRYYCDNKCCFEKNVWKLTFAVWKQWFNIDWFWEKQVRLFLKKWIISTLDSIFLIKNKKDEILNLEWFQDKSVNNLVEAVEKSKKVKLSVLITSLWIAWVWKKVSKSLSLLLKDVIKGKQDISELTIDDFELIDDIWSEIAFNVISYFEDIYNKKIVERLVELLEIEYPEQKKANLVFSWKKFCITWSFDNYKRDDLIEIIEKNWWEFVWSISKKLDFLLAWDKAWSKLKKANDLWVFVLSIDDFLLKIDF